MTVQPAKLYFIAFHIVMVIIIVKYVFWDDFLCFRWKRGSAPARELLVGLVSPVGDRWAVFRGICCILVPTGCCSDLEGWNTGK